MHISCMGLPSSVAAARRMLDLLSANCQIHLARFSIFPSEVGNCESHLGMCARALAAEAHVSLNHRIASQVVAKRTASSCHAQAPTVLLCWDRFHPHTSHCVPASAGQNRCRKEVTAMIRKTGHSRHC